ncbi:MAG: hypothetical protein V1896_01605 [Candidatus Zambryskibacteria bacterium]
MALLKVWLKIWLKMKTKNYPCLTFFVNFGTLRQIKNNKYE